jgi:hypothetical protein
MASGDENSTQKENHIDFQSHRWHSELRIFRLLLASRMTRHLDKEIWAIATSVLSQHQRNARAYAKRRAKAALRSDDLIDHRIWMAVGTAVEELMRTPDDEEEVN